MNVKKNIFYWVIWSIRQIFKKLHKEAAKDINKSNIHKVFVYGKFVNDTFNKITKQKKESS